MTDQSVKNLASIFNQPIQGPGMGRPLVSPKPGVAARPAVSAKPGKLDLSASFKIIGPNVRSPLFDKSSNGASKTPASKVLPKHVAGKPLGGPIMGAKPEDILNMKSNLKKPPMPRPPIISTASEGSKIDFKRSLKKPPVAIPPSKVGGSIKTPMTEEEKENISTSKSDGDSSSLSSFTSDSSFPRRGSGQSQRNGNKMPRLEPLPPLEVLGSPPVKPAKPQNVILPKQAVAPPVLRKKPASVSFPEEAVTVEEDFGDLYDDVTVDTKAEKKRVSLIPTMDSDEEDHTEDLIYDDTDVMTAPSLPSIPIPSLPSVPQTSGSDDIPQEIYDDVSLDGECEELYEALDVSTEDVENQRRTSVESADSSEASAKAPPLLSPRKTISQSQKNKQEEKLRREQEKQEQQRLKKEEELRKKREKEEKKKKDKEEKETKKKFNIRGDILVIDVGTAIQDCGSDYEKLDLISKRGEKIEIIRREGNPPGKWLARDTQGRYGYIDADFVAIESDCQETYDDVIPCDESGSDEEEVQEIYEAFD